jgi:hypothetical protein
VSDAEKPKGNWVAPSAEVHEERFGKGSFAAVAGQFGKALKPLAAHYPPEQIAAHYSAYLDETPTRFLNFNRFAGTFLEYKPKETVTDDGFLVD